GPKGELKNNFGVIVGISLKEEDGKKQIVTSVAHPEELNEKTHWGTVRSIIAGMVQGVSQGFEKKLELVGVGYKVSVSGKEVKLDVGFSHPVKYQLPEGIEAKAEKNILCISGIDKQLVGQVTAEIRSVRKPEPYKGKGIKYVGEVIRRKAGKAAKSGAAG
ncbi:50S ribosomal protein L6, partial [Patescibacteria group bacterium]|nr:50S ribosomal protein L6 [Patescibacteria group bacterium]MBU1922074.1 50S ribosomal protein L6 [Patescibacteria group bacterium]